MSRTPRIADICERLHLSKATVSKALNGYPSVQEETRNRVLACARELGYSFRQNNEMNARLIRIGLSSIGDIGNPEGTSPFQLLLSSLLNELEQFHYDAVILPPAVLREQSVPYEQAMQSLNLDCTFLTGLRLDEPYYQQLQSTRFPTVMWDMSIDNPHVHNVSSDSTEGLRLATQHLLALGHRRIGFISGHLQAPVSLQRRDGYILGLADAGIQYDPALVYIGDFSETSGAIGLQRLLEQDITGIVCVSDVTALGVFRTAQVRGLRIPQDLSIVGYDNTNLTGYMNPGLTSVDQHIDQVGRVIATTIHNIVNHQPVGDSVIHPSLVIRGSTAPPGS